MLLLFLLLFEPFSLRERVPEGRVRAQPKPLTFAQKPKQLNAKSKAFAL